jgi:hypothetical protein
MKSSQILVIATGLIIFAVIALILTGLPVTRSGPGEGPTSLSAVEVRSYQGADLSSVNDFRENSIRGPQRVNISGYRLTVTGLTNTTDVYTYDEVLGQYPHYTKVVTLFCVEGWDATILWEGIQVKDLIRHAGPDPRANTVIFTAQDGVYHVVPARVPYGPRHHHGLPDEQCHSSCGTGISLPTGG